MTLDDPLDDAITLDDILDDTVAIDDIMDDTVTKPNTPRTTGKFSGLPTDFGFGRNASRRKGKFSGLPTDFGFGGGSQTGSQAMQQYASVSEQMLLSSPASSGLGQTVFGYAKKIVTNPAVRETFALLGYDPLGMMSLVGRLDHPLGISSEVIGKTLELTVGADSDVAKAKAIYDWIAGKIPYDDPRTHQGYRNALQTYADKRGICGELTYLYTAMARIAGVPCQKVSVRINDLGEKVIHACAGVQLQGATLLVDPSYRQSDGFGVQHREFTVIPDEKMIREYQEWNGKKPTKQMVTIGAGYTFTGVTRRKPLGNHLHDIHGTHSIGIPCETYYHPGTSCVQFEKDLLRWIEPPMHEDVRT